MMELVSQASFSDAHETKSIPVIAANLQRVIRPEQSQIWAVMRKEDDADRIHYSIINTLFGRLGLSGDIYDLNEEQWGLIDEGIAFYQEAADIIKDGVTTNIESTVKSYNKLTGHQIVTRQLGDRLLVIAHRFADSAEIQGAVPQGYRVLREYGEVSRDFSAKAWILQRA
jgi:alpha-galactosidase